MPANFAIFSFENLVSLLIHVDYVLVFVQFGVAQASPHFFVGLGAVHVLLNTVQITT